jgi:hypothetical protein
MLHKHEKLKSILMSYGASGGLLSVGRRDNDLTRRTRVAVRMEEVGRESRDTDKAKWKGIHCERSSTKGGK